jgi:hypothetical protein
MVLGPAAGDRSGRLNELNGEHRLAFPQSYRGVASIEERHDDQAFESRVDLGAE